MFERWTEETKRALALAESLAGESGQHYIAADHLLVGLIDVDDPTVDQALQGHGAQVRLAALAELKRRRKPVPLPLPVLPALARVFAAADKDSERRREPVQPVDLLRALTAAHERTVEKALKATGSEVPTESVDELVPEDLALSAVLGELRETVTELRDEIALLRVEIAELRRER